MKKKENNPFDWDNISIEKYFTIKDILDDPEDDDITKNVKLVALITDKDESEIWDMDMSTVGGYIDKLRFLNKFDLPKSPTLKIQLPTYKLQVMKDLSKINVSQYVDFQNFITKPFSESMEKILSIFLIPEGKSYNTDYDIVNLQKEIRENLSFRVAEGLFNFFMKRYNQLLMHSLTYLNKTIRKMKDKEMKENLIQKKEELIKKHQDLMHLVGCV